MDSINKLVNIAIEEVGYMEKGNTNNLDSKDKGASNGNCTKYWRDIAPKMQGNPWCQCFVIWCFVKAFGEKIAKKMLNNDGPWSFYTPTSAQYYKNTKRWYKDPLVGDQIFFKNNVRINHTGIVYKVEGNKVFTIEGNTSSSAGVVENGGCVAKKSYNLNNSRIDGYGRPDYGLTKSTPPIFQNVYPQKGVDVAAWQKGLNYEALRDAGVKFGVLKIIRKDLSPDEMFETHYQGFFDAGIPIKCVYNYSYATTVEKAKIDANKVVSILNGRKIPVVLDVEDECQNGLGERLAQIINGYNQIIDKAGLKFLVYTGLNFYKKNIQPYLSLIDNKQFWIARYPNNNNMSLDDNPNPDMKPDVNGIIAWQYTSKGSIPKAYKGDLDFDILYAPIIEQLVHSEGICTVHLLRIRSGPSTKYGIKGYVKKNEKVTIYGTDSETGWYKIDREQSLWVSNAYIQKL